MELLADGYNQSGVYNITPIPGFSKIVYCDQNFNGGGWMVIMRNKYGNITFDQSWDKYKNGFGFLQNDIWLGNEFLYQMTTPYKAVRGNAMDLYIKLIDNNTFYAKYSRFVVDPEEDKYFLRDVDGYSGTAGDSLTYSKSKYFSTKDNDNDNIDDNCATISQNKNDPATLGGWWYNSCYKACLTKTYGVYDSARKTYLPAPQWYQVGQNYRYLKGAEMMIRKKS